MFMKTQHLEGRRRYRELYSKHPPAEVLQFIERISVARNGERKMFHNSGAMAFCWVIWRKGHTAKPTLDWISAA